LDRAELFLAPELIIAEVVNAFTGSIRVLGCFRER
jgi:hypothetical protein